jgi:hypothetical protein
MIGTGSPPTTGTYRIRNVNAATSAATDATTGYHSVLFGNLP